MNDQSDAVPALMAALPAITFQRFTLDNGLRLLVHEDASASTVAVHMTYAVGAKDEPAGMFGFAHLMEHLMFSGSAALPGSYISHLERAGAEGLNGVTSADTTQFFQSVPPGSLDFALFAESDRMGHLLAGLPLQALEVQRDVVTREMEENELQPLGAVQGVILRNLFPAEHPYAHKVAGERADLQQASFTQVQAWSRRFYRPDNAVMTLAGAVTADEALEKVSRWFGAIAPGEPMETLQRWVPVLNHDRRVKLQDRTESTLLRFCWVIPPYGEEDTTALTLFAGVLADTADSLLVARLMVDQPLVSDLSAFVEPGMLASYFNLRMVLQPGARPEEVEHIVRQTLKEIMAADISRDLLHYSQQHWLQNGLASWSDNLSLAAELGRHEILPVGAEGVYQLTAQALSMTATTVTAAARRGLLQGCLLLQVDPFTPVNPRRDADYVRIPPEIHLAAPTPPALSHQRVLSNGLRVLITSAQEEGLLSASLVVAGGSLNDLPQQGGMAQLVAGLVSAAESGGESFQQQLWSLGAGLALDVGPASIALRLQMPEHQAEHVCEQLAGILCGDPLSADALTAHRDHYLQSLSGRDVVSWALPAMTFPPSHPLRRPAFTQGSARSLQQLTLEDARRFYQRHYQPQTSTLLLRSALPVDRLEALLENTLGRWQPSACDALPPVAVAAAAPVGALMLVDVPGAAVTTLVVHFSLPGCGSSQDAAVQLIHSLLSASFASRINFALREVDRLTYNVTPLQQRLPGSCLLGFELTVAADATLAAVAAICRELRALLADRPLSEEEMQGLLQMAFLRQTRPVSNDYDALCRQEARLREGRQDDSAQRAALQALSVGQVNTLLQQTVHPASAKWILRGAVAALSHDLASLLTLPAVHFPDNPDDLYE